MYDPSAQLNEKNNYAESSGDDESTTHHFYHKLFKLGDNMNTKITKKLAEKRTNLMKDFVH